MATAIQRILILWLAFGLWPGHAGAQTFQWVKSGQGTAFDPLKWNYMTYGLACASGKVAATGFFAETMTLDNTLLFSSVGEYPNAFTGQWTANGNSQWLQAAGGPVGAGRRGEAFQGRAIGMDANGNSYVAYTVSNDAWFDTVFVQVNRPVGTFQCSVLVKYTPAGRVVWVQVFKGGEYVELTAVSVTPTGTVIVGGVFNGSMPIGSQTLICLYSTYGHGDAFVATLNTSGTLLWARQLTALNTTNTGGYSTVKGLAVDNVGNVIVAGEFNRAMSLAPGISLTATPPPPLISSIRDAPDAFLAKYTSQGAYLWSRQIGGPGYDYATAVIADAGGNIFVAGNFGNVYSAFAGNTATFTSTAGTPFTTLTAMLNPTGSGTSYQDGYVARYDPQGTLSWARPITGPGRENILSLATSAQGAVYVAGSAYYGTLFDATTTFQSGYFGYNGFVVKYNAAGQMRWLTGYNGFMQDNELAGMCLASDGVGHLYVGGAFQGNTMFGTIAVAGAVPTVQYPYIAAMDDNEIVLSSRNPTQTDQQLAAHPNPSTGRIQLSWSPAQHPARLNVRDVLGRLVRTEALGATETTRELNLTDLPRGVYLLQLVGNDQTLTRRIVLE